ncbi:MAG: hypothetical protein QHH14_12805 [Clostridiales bacterium]|nr:hypothetical protein [Clostridiales bacterium]
MRPVRLIISIDVECDKGPKWIIRKPMSFFNITHGVHRLQALFNEFKIKPTYLLSPEVLMNEKCTKLFQSLGNKAEIGVHMHGEFIEPEADFGTARTNSFQDDFPAEAEFQKIANLTKLFEERFGFRPKSFRAGRFGLSKHTLRFLERLGYQVDSSVTPFAWWWRRKGHGVNFLGAPNEPYFPSSNDFRKPGKMKILEVPVSIINTFWSKFPHCLLRRINPLNRAQTILINTLLGERSRSVWLRPTFSTLEQMIFVTKQIFKKAISDAPILNMMFHSNEATAGMSPYHQSEADVDDFLNKLNGYLDFLCSMFNVQFITLSEAKTSI